MLIFTIINIHNVCMKVSKDCLILQKEHVNIKTDCEKMKFKFIEFFAINSAMALPICAMSDIYTKLNDSFIDVYLRWYYQSYPI